MKMLMALAFAGVLMLAGCGGGGSKTASMGDRTPTPTPTPEPEPTPTPDPVGGTPTPEPDPTPTPAPPGPAPVAIQGLPTGHMLAPGVIPAGESRTLGEADSMGMGTALVCPAGGADCNIMVASDGSATSTGGAPTIATFEVPFAQPPPFGDLTTFGKREAVLDLIDSWANNPDGIIEHNRNDSFVRSERNENRPIFAEGLIY